jgi:hypothetical protein
MRAAVELVGHEGLEPTAPAAAPAIDDLEVEL